MKVDGCSLSLTQLSCLFRGRKEIQLIMTFLFSSEREICQEAARQGGNRSPSPGRQWLTFKLRGKLESHGQHHEGHKWLVHQVKVSSHPVLSIMPCLSSAKETAQKNVHKNCKMYFSYWLFKAQ